MPTMNKREFLKTGGLLGVASILPSGGLMAGEAGADGACVLIPSETAGPFPLDLTANSFYFRQDIREDRSGVTFTVRLRVLGLNNCLPMANVRVNIWHCDKDGVYSGYTGQQGGLNTTGLTFLRGYQITDANGEVEFTTIFPGWYTGRVCHIHFQVYVSSSYAAISQLTFPVAAKQAIYAANPSLYTNGADPTAIASDNIFSDGYQYQLATLEDDGQGGYTSFLEVSVQGNGSGTSGLQEFRNAERFEVGQNFPNPFYGNTVIPITLKGTGELSIDLYDVQGRRVAAVTKSTLPAGDHFIPVDLNAFGLPHANYAYQVGFISDAGTFTTCKLMTAGK